jgi:hypothetical protein
MRVTIILAIAAFAIAGHAFTRQQTHALAMCMESHSADTCHHILR